MTWAKRAETHDDGGRAEHPRGSRRRYDNLMTVSASMRGYGRVLKIGGWIIGIGGGLAGAAVSGTVGDLSKMISIPFIVLACAAGLAVHAMGTTVAAIGEGLMAVSDIALNTWAGSSKSGKRRGNDDESDEAEVA
jgi:hypothetical protein